MMLQGGVEGERGRVYLEAMRAPRRAVVLAGVAAVAIGVSAGPASADDPTAVVVDGVLVIQGDTVDIQNCTGDGGVALHVNGQDTGIDCASFTSVDITGTDAASHVTLLWSDDRPITVHGAGGDDFIHVQAVAGPVVIDGGEGNDDILAASQSIGITAGPGDDSAQMVAFNDAGHAIDVEADLGVGVDLGGLEMLPTGTQFLFPYPGGYRGLDDSNRVADFLAVEHMHVTVQQGAQIDITPAIGIDVLIQHSGPIGKVFLDARDRPFAIDQSPGHNDVLQVQGFATIEVTKGSQPTSYSFYDGRLNRYIPVVYQTFLGRDADSGGFGYWLARILIDRLPRPQFIASMLRLPEHADLTVRDLYQSILHRDGEASGVAFWSHYLQVGNGLDPLRSLLYGSDEYFATRGGGIVDGFLDALYLDVLHRLPDDGGRALWTGRIEHGTSRTLIAASILGLPEPVDVVIKTHYEHLVGRTPGATEIGYWRSQWPNDGEFRLIAELAGSGEYYEIVAPVDPVSPVYWPDG
jgi:hypothetical protein